MNGFEFLKLLARWKGSVYKLLWKDLTIFLTTFYLLHILYIAGLSDENKIIFEGLVKYASRYGDFIPMSFVLGFFVSNVMTRWWNQYLSIPWPTSIAVYVSSTIHGYDDVGRAMRRTIMRYVCLSLTMVLRTLSPRVKKRFPKMTGLIDAGLLHENELIVIENLEQNFPGYSKNFLPIVWAASIVTRARKEGRIRDDYAVTTIITALNKFRGQCGNLMTYNSISIPLVYTQVVTIAVYTYFITSLMAQQSVGSHETSNIDFIPVFITLQFVFYMGWLKVAETLMNPFGDDDDDFEVNHMIDRNLQMSYLIVDDMHNDHPELLKDQYWDEMPQTLLGQTDEKVEDIDERDDVNYEIVQTAGCLSNRTSITIAEPFNETQTDKVRKQPRRSGVKVTNFFKEKCLNFLFPAVSNIRTNRPHLDSSIFRCFRQIQHSRCSKGAKPYRATNGSDKKTIRIDKRRRRKLRNN